jgi:hypothetical protein
MTDIPLSEIEKTMNWLCKNLGELRSVILIDIVRALKRKKWIE